VFSENYRDEEYEIEQEARKEFEKLKKKKNT